VEAAQRSGLLANKWLPIEEERFFYLGQSEYLNKRNFILSRWVVDTTRFLNYNYTFDEDIYRYLVRFGVINFGIVRNRVTPTKKDKTIIVIGAGMAGISCAHQLQSAGYTVVLLEGSDRIGGRCLTKSTYKDGVKSSSIDMGASIITGTIGNKLAVLCDQFGINLHVIGTNYVTYDSKGIQVPKKKDMNMEKIFNVLLEETCKNKKHVYQSLGKSLMKKIDKLEDKDTIDEQCLKWHVANLEYGLAIDLEPVSLMYWDQDDEFELSGDHCFIKSGYGSIVSEYASELDVLLSHKVKKITYQGDSVTVETTKGTLKADACVCTSSLGYLQQNLLEFSPKLPTWKQQAIDDLGFGLLNKFAMWFDQSFWDIELDYFGYLNPDNRGEYYLFWNLTKVCGRPTLVALLTGKAAYQYENESEKTAYDKIMKILRTIFGQNTPKPNKFYKTVWFNDEFARGSYSYVKVGSKGGQDYDLMTKPVHNLFFAGEACSREHPSTVLGALCSGLKTAGFVDEFFQGKKRKQDLMEPSSIMDVSVAYKHFSQVFDHILQQRLIADEDTLKEIVSSYISVQIGRDNSDELVWNEDSYQICKKYVDEYVRLHNK
jgi:lysine-specific histone demethylase 1